MGSLRSTEEQILRLACRAVTEIESMRGTLDDILDTPDFRTLRRTLSHLLLGYFKYKKFIDGTLEKFIRRTPDKQTGALLKTALAQAVLQQKSAPEAVVNVAVEMAKKLRTQGFVNAVLRKSLAECREKTLPSEPEQILPDQLLSRWKNSFSDAEISRMTEAFLSSPEFTFRVEKRAMPKSFSWRSCYTPSDEFPFGTAEPSAVLGSEEFRAGSIYIQDPAAAFAVSLAPDCDFRNILDLCSAPGGKSLMLLEKYPHTKQFISFDRSSKRQELTRKNFDLRGINFPTVSDRKYLQKDYDLILVDAPCSNTGVFRRRPDALWRFSAEDMKKNAVIQAELLDEAASRLISGGYLIYSTCSIEKEEDELQISSFLERHRDFVPVKSGKLLPCVEHDGAFSALLKKTERTQNV